MHRFFTEPENIIGDIAYIVDDASHITRTLRMKIGDKITVFDGTGKEYICRLSQIEKNKCTAKIDSESFSASEPDIKVTVFQGIPKSGKMESIIQKSVELGVFEIVPVDMERCVVRLDNGKKQSERIKRWNKVALEAAKQCGRGIVPKITEPCSFSKAVELANHLDLAVMPYEVLGHKDDRSLKNILKAEFDTIGIIIGPEGGFSDAEAEYANENNIKLTGLGKRILRTETVSSAVISIIMYEKNQI